MIEGTKKQQTYKLINGSIDVNAARYVLVLPMKVNTASLIFEERLMLPVHVSAAITKVSAAKVVIHEYFWALEVVAAAQCWSWPYFCHSSFSMLVILDLDLYLDILDFNLDIMIFSLEIILDTS
ncbi:hypothetical protein Tco_0295545 [Tanacetum coccineum]